MLEHDDFSSGERLIHRTAKVFCSKPSFVTGSRATTSLGLPLGFATVLYLEVPDSN